MATKKPRVAVVGAGLAGVATAWSLERRGIAVTLIEREERVGGRCAFDTVEGFALEAMSPVLWSDDHDLLGWIAETSARDELLPLRPVWTAQVHGAQVHEVDARSPLEVARVPGVRVHQALRLLRLPRLMKRYGARLDPAAPERAAPLDDRSLGDFGRLYFGRSVLDRWMAPLVGCESLASEEDTSRALFLLRILTHGNARPALPRAPLGASLESIAQRLRVLDRTEVVAIDTDKKKEGLEITCSRNGRQRTVNAQAVILATPAGEAGRIAAPLLTGAERALLAGIRYVPALTLAAGTVRRLAQRALLMRVPSSERTPLQTALLEPGVRGERVPHGHGAFQLRATGEFAEAAVNLPDDKIEKEMLDAFERFHPGARGTVLFMKILRHPQGRPRFDVGHYRTLARLEGVQRDLRRAGRRIYFASDWRMHPSWSGAFAAAQRAVGEVTDDLR